MIKNFISFLISTNKIFKNTNYAHIFTQTVYNNNNNNNNNLLGSWKYSSIKISLLRKCTTFQGQHILN